MPWIHGDWVDDEASLARPPSRWPFDPYIRQVLERAGWVPLPLPAPSARGDAGEFAQALLQEFGGLNLGESRQHGERFHEIAFQVEASPLPDSDMERWPFLAGSMVIARVACDYATLFVDGEGEFFVIDDIRNSLRALGKDLVAVVNLFVRELEWPDPLPD